MRYSCPLYPRKRTFAVQLGMSAKCQKRTLASFNYFVRSCEHLARHGQAEARRRFQIDYQFKLVGFLYGEIGWFCALRILST